MSEARKRILNMVAEGKITVDQAEELLTALEADQKSAPPGETTQEKKKRLGDEIKAFAQQIQNEVAQAMKGINPQTQEIKESAKKLGNWFQEMVESVTQNFSKTFSSSFDGVECNFKLSEPAEFASCNVAEIGNHYGSITIREGSAFELQVKGRLAKMAFGNQTPEEWFAANGLKVQDGKLIIGIDSFLPVKGTFDFELTIPPHLPLRCRVLAGNLIISGNLTIEKAQSVSGSLDFRQTTLKNCQIETVSGDVRIEDSKIALDFKTSSGELEIRRGYLHSLHAQVISGDIQILEPKVDDATVIDVLTTSGDVCIANPSGGFGKVIANTRTGTLTSTWGGISISETGNTIRQDGVIGARLTIETISGDICLR